MGSACGSGDKDTTTKNIDKMLVGVEKNERRENKLLLLGTGSAGKSTLFKGLRLVNHNQFEPSEKVDTRRTIRSNIVASIMTLLQKSQMLYEKDPERFAGCKVNITDSKVIQSVQVLITFAEESFSDDENMPSARLVSLAGAVTSLWGLDSLRLTYEHRQYYSFLDNMEYYFAKVNEIMKVDYIPNDEDVLKARIRTTGLIEMVYEKDDNIFKICDVGGQRSERKKWIHSFEQVSGIIFVMALNHYACVLFEDERRNAMHESMELFDDICNSKWFRKAEIMLFLNKDDLFRETLGGGHSLSLCFSKDKGWTGTEWDPSMDYVSKPNVPYTNDPDFGPCYQAALQFILDRYLEINEDKEKTIFSHVTCATDSDSIEKVFWDVQNIVIKANLRKGGLIV